MAGIVSDGSLRLDAVDAANPDEYDRLSRKTGKFRKLCITDPDASMATGAAGRQLLPSCEQHASVDASGICRHRFEADAERRHHR